jgi:hypothetical protein
LLFLEEDFLMPSITISYPAGDGVRFAAALGKAQSLKDAQGEPRSATAAECKAFLIGRAWQLIVDVEGGELTAAAVASVVVPPVDMT